MLRLDGLNFIIINSWNDIIEDNWTEKEYLYKLYTYWCNQVKRNGIALNHNTCNEEMIITKMMNF